MSRQLALDSIWLRPTSRLAHTDYSLEYHQEYITRTTGLAPGEPGRMRRFYECWGIDFLWSTNDGLHGDWGRCGRATDMGHAEYAADGGDRRAPRACPFKAPEEVWAFDAVAEYGLPSFQEQVAAYEEGVQHARRTYPDQLVTGGYYKSIVSGAIQAFGWDMLLLAAADRKKMERVFDGFFRRTLFHMQAWAKTSVEAIIQHDDFVWTQGPFMHPDIYRKGIIPRYAELWKPLKAAGKKVLFCSDGSFMDLAEDVVAAGADGLIFEPCNDLRFMVERFGGSHALVGSCVDCRDLAFAPWERSRAAMDRTFALAKECKGLIFAVGNHLPANVPPHMMDRYIAYLQANWQR